MNGNRIYEWKNLGGGRLIFGRTLNKQLVESGVLVSCMGIIGRYQD